jgi:hypothetical protein
MPTSITEKDYVRAAKALNIKTAAVKAVKEVESSGNGFLVTGEVKILFEPHIFWKQLKVQGLDPAKLQKANPDIIYLKWGEKPYGKVSAQWGRLNRAIAINRQAALRSCSWGLFQIMGFNFKACGCTNVDDFVKKMALSEGSQLDLFVNYIKSSFLDDELRVLDWRGFAKQYNGPQYEKNQYHIKLDRAYQKYSM